MSNTTDLTQRAPRSMRETLGGYALLPRMLDKGRAEIAGKNGEYHFACPLDQRILEFLGLDPAALRKELASGKGDGEILAWIKANQTNQHTPDQIAAWTDEQVKRGPDADSRDFFEDMRKGAAPARTEITTWAELLDLDDYVSFGGQA